MDKKAEILQEDNIGWLFPEVKSKTLHFNDREEFNKAVDKYLYDPKLIDIGYSDMIISLKARPYTKCTD